MVLVLLHMLRICLPTGPAPVEAGLETTRTRNSIPPLTPLRAALPAQVLKKGTGTTTDSGLAYGEAQPVVEPVPFFSTGARPVGMVLG